VSRYILDTNIVTLSQHGNANIAERAKVVGIDNIFITTVTLEEQLKGRLAAISRCGTKPELLPTAYQNLLTTQRYFCNMNLLEFNQEYCECFKKLRQQKINIGTQDLRIAAIGLIQDIYPLLPNFIDKHILDVYNNYLEMLSFLKTNVLNDKICNLQFEIVISSLSFEQINNLIENEGFDEIKFIYLDMGNSIISKVTFTLDEFKDLIIGDLSQYQENSNICISGIRSHKSEVKSSKLSESLIFYENRNLQEEWKLTYKDINMLRDYYDANLLITYSLYLTSPEVRSYIEETLLLPIEEIEKHPFKYQE